MRKVTIEHSDEETWPEYYNPDVRTFRVSEGIITPKQIQQIQSLGWHFALIASSYLKTWLTIALWSTHEWKGRDDNIHRKIMDILSVNPAEPE